MSEAKKFYVPKTYAKANVYPLWNRTPIRSSNKPTAKDLESALKDPYRSYKMLQRISNYLWANSAVYQNLSYYLATVMTFDYIVAPMEMTDNQKTMWNRLENSAKAISKSQPREVFPIMTLRTLVNGETFWYDLSDSKNTIFVEIDSNVCQMLFIDDDNLWRYGIDLALLTVDSVYEMPDEIQIAYNNWLEGGKSKEKTQKLIDGIEFKIPNNIHVVSKKGFSIFSHMQKGSHDYPYFASMFMDLMNLEDDKSYFNEFLKAQNIKVIHLQIPVDENGAPSMEEDDVRAFHESAKQHLPSNVAPLTNPFKVEGITLDASQSAGVNLVEHSKNIVQSDSGVSSTLFESNTTNGMKYSTMVDATKMYPLLYYFNNLMNYKIKDYKFTCTFLHINVFNKDEKHKQYANELANGGSRFLYMATSDIDLYQYIMIAKLETLLNVDELLPIKLNANQASASVGREALPADQQSDNTVRLQ